jgi:dimethylhistidine N-methyltransferase
MMGSLAPLTSNRAADINEFAFDVVHGLTAARKSLPCRYFYDSRGSNLFEQITRLPEYYQTRTEAAILAAYAADMVGSVKFGSLLVEFGSGSSTKTELLLDRISAKVTYVPIDISRSALREAVVRLKRLYPTLEVRPIIADFSSLPPLSNAYADQVSIGFFPGSTIGNFDPISAIALLERFRASLTQNSRMLIGVDLKKDIRKLLRAYNDSSGVTAVFNLNILERINRELGAKIDISNFKHQAIYNPRLGRIEMYLVSRSHYETDIVGRRIRFSPDESIHTENSYKYSVVEFQDLARQAGWTSNRVWTDPNELFSVHELTTND